MNLVKILLCVSTQLAVPFNIWHVTVKSLVSLYLKVYNFLERDLIQTQLINVVLNFHEIC